MSNSHCSSTTESSTSGSRPPLAPINTNELENRRHGKRTSQATTTTSAAAATPARATAAPYEPLQRQRRTLRIDTTRATRPLQWMAPPNEAEIRRTTTNNLQSLYLQLQSERTVVLAKQASYLCDAFGIFDIPAGQDLDNIDQFNLPHDHQYTSLQEHAKRLEKHIAMVLEMIQQFEFTVRRSQLFDQLGYLKTNNYTHGPLFGLSNSELVRERAYVTNNAPPSPATVRRNTDPISPSDLTQEQLDYMAGSFTA
ncbi:hypothetical protein F5H01DRAFT_363537 [Linnemannia elongata]|nr:hypothetical protein F5H01DRAFT_363537 [Linnemannia elongata]